MNTPADAGGINTLVPSHILEEALMPWTLREAMVIMFLQRLMVVQDRGDHQTGVIFRHMIREAAEKSKMRKVSRGYGSIETRPSVGYIAAIF